MGSKNKKFKKDKDDGGATDGARDNSHRRGGKKVITDSRFASVHSDPRFAKFTKHKSKVMIDSRFERMFTDKSFCSSVALIDKRGKPKKDFQNPIKRYYRLEEEEHEKEKKSIGQVKYKDVKFDEESEESDSERDEKLKIGGKQLSDLKLKNISEELKSESEEDDNEEKVEDASTDDDFSTDTTDSDEEYEIGSEELEDFIPEQNIPDIDKETHRLAVVNLDWSHVTAVDLYVLLSSFLAKGGNIFSVGIYPSEFGLKRMEEEAVRGPVVLFDEDEEPQESDDDDNEIDIKKLREYELSRLRYYYAVVECDSITTADGLYKTCDGIEFERSSNKLDLRFIPDSMEFKHPARDVATEVPENYQALDFQTRALQQSNIHLTWEDDEPQRAKALQRKFNGDQLAELELKEFMASDESETDEDGNDDPTEDQSQKKRKKQDLYRALLQSGEGSEDDDEGGQDMEVTFNTGLEDISKHALEKKDKKSETIWEAQLRKRREKKMASRKNSSKYSTDESSDGDLEPKDDVDDFFVEEPLLKASKDGKSKNDKKRKKKKKEKEDTAKGEEEAASISELELLLADNNGADTVLKGYNLKPKKVDANGKKGRREKRKREKITPDEEKIPNADYDDPRFSALFTSPLFALDPTDPQFKRSETYLRQLAQKQRKSGREVLGSKPAQLPSDDLPTDKNESLQSGEMSSKKEKFELSSLVRSIKMKSKQVQIFADSKISEKTGKSASKSRW